MTVGDPSRRRRAVATAAGLTVGGLAYLLTLLDYATDLTRTAVAGRFLANFFDLQGRAFLDGRVDLPAGSLGIEGFLHDGRTYTYFPPFPTALRMPVLMTTSEFDGRLTLLSMGIAWAVFATVCAYLAWFVVDLVSEQATTSRGTAVLVGLFLAGATGGTFLTFDAGQPWVYHEVYMWAVTGATGSLYWLLRTLVSGETRAVTWLFWFALVTTGTRATEGWAICLTVIGVALLLRFRPRTSRHQAIWWRVLLAGAVPLALSIALNLYKFDSVYMFPLDTQVWTSVSPRRREALAANGGSLTGPQFFTTSFMAYLRPDGIRFTGWFPFVTLPATPPPAYNGAFYDQAYRTGSVTAFMPLFMVGFLVSAVLAFRPGAPQRLSVLRAPFVASVLVTGGVMGYGYYSNRYASEFVPAMVLGGAVGVALLVRLLARRPRLRVPVTGLVAAGSAFAIVAQMATGSAAAATMARGDRLVRFLTWQERLSPVPPPVRRVSSFPTGGETDDLAIRGDCDGLYLNSGDQYEPWLTVTERDRVIVLRRSDRLREGTAPLLTVEGRQRASLELEVGSDQLVRFVLRDEEGRAFGDWIDLGPASSGVLRVGVRHDTANAAYLLESTPGGPIGTLPSRFLDAEVDTQPTRLDILPSVTDLARLGVGSSLERGPVDPLCSRVASRAPAGTVG